MTCWLTDLHTWIWCRCWGSTEDRRRSHRSCLSPGSKTGGALWGNLDL